jgi:hypothetical protein
VLTKSGAFRRRPGRGKREHGQSTISKVGGQGGNYHTKDDLIDQPTIDKAELCKQSAAEIDMLYWSLLNMILPTKDNDKIKETVSPVAIGAMAQGFEQMENPPKLHWAASVGLIYTSATIAILRHPESKPRVLSWKEKLFLFFSRKKKGQAERKD